MAALITASVWHFPLILGGRFVTNGKVCACEQVGQLIVSKLTWGKIVSNTYAAFPVPFITQLPTCVCLHRRRVERGRRWLGCVPGQCCSLCHLKGAVGNCSPGGSVALRARVRLYWCHVPLALVVMPAALPWNFCNISGSWSDCSAVVYFFPARVRFLSSLSILSWFPMLSHEPGGGICLQCAWF